MKRLLILCLAASLFGCSYQRAHTRVYSDNGKLKKDVRCHSIIIGDGDIATFCEYDGKMYFSSKGTGFSEMAPETFGALGTLIGNAIATGSGSGAAIGAGAEVIGTGAKALKDRLGDDVSEVPTPQPVPAPTGLGGATPEPAPTPVETGLESRLPVDVFGEERRSLGATTGVFSAEDYDTELAPEEVE